MTSVAQDDDVQIEKLTLGPFGTNCYIVTCRKTQESILVDTPAEAEVILEELKKGNLNEKIEKQLAEIAGEVIEKL